MGGVWVTVCGGADGLTGWKGRGSGNLITAEPAKRLARAVRERAAAETLALTQLLLLRNIVGPEEQLNVTHILGRDWKYTQEVRRARVGGRAGRPGRTGLRSESPGDPSRGGEPTTPPQDGPRRGAARCVNLKGRVACVAEGQLAS